MFSFIKNKLQKLYNTVTSALGTLFSRTKVDENTLTELELILIKSDAGVKTSRTVIGQLRDGVLKGTISQGTALRTALHDALLGIMDSVPPFERTGSVFVLVGINGSGKTTFAGKLAHYFAVQGKKVLLVAADTFRAAAPEQLAQWARTTQAHIITGKPGQDPASVVFSGCEQFVAQQYDILIIDTAGRLQAKTHLMQELAKIKRTIIKKLPDAKIHTLLTVDSMLGQNSLEQAQLFKECTDVDGIVLTKMDGTGKGGIVFAIAHELKIPVAYIAYGEQLNDFKPFHAQQFVQELVEM
jgi:fused signal recognition particle receptor